MKSKHICTPETCPAGSYFVTAVDGPALYYMAGPYPEHSAALADVDKALHLANKHDGRAWFMSWGTVRVIDGSQHVGSLNKAGLL